jgi:hypothetical protein
MSDKPPEPTPKGTYQVWHHVGAGYQHVANVQGNGLLRDVHALTTHRAGRPWPHNSGVEAMTEQPRSTGNGDVIVSPAGWAFEVQRDGYMSFEFHPEMLSPIAFERLKHELRDEAASRQLLEKGVDYGDAPYGSVSEGAAGRGAASTVPGEPGKLPSLKDILSDRQRSSPGQERGQDKGQETGREI